MRSTRRWLGYVLLAVVVLVSGAPVASAQSDTALTGRVEDETGGLLPGVTVVAQCDCLLADRETVTGAEGRFNLAGLPVGVYTVTFSLAGFSTVIVEGVETRALTTTTANATLGVGAVQEAVTVTGAPTIDIVNVREQRSQRMDTLEALPTGARDYTALGKVMLGVSQGNTDRQDVGGAFAEINNGLSVHGSLGGQSRATYDGMNTNIQIFDGGGQMRIWKFNTIAVQETTIDVAGGNARTATGGANINMVPRSGSNVFSGHSFLTYNPGRFGTAAVPDSVIERSNGQLTEALFHKRVWDLGLGVGGPLVQDRAWFFVSGREWGGESNAADNFYNKSPDFWRYEEDRTRPAFTSLWQRDYGARFTIQATPTHRISQDTHWQMGCGCKLGTSLGDPSSPEAVAEFGYGTDRLGGGKGMWLSQTELERTGDESPALSGRRLAAVPGSLLLELGSPAHRGRSHPDCQSVRKTHHLRPESGERHHWHVRRGESLLHAQLPRVGRLRDRIAQRLGRHQRAVRPGRPGGGHGVAGTDLLSLLPVAIQSCGGTPPDHAVHDADHQQYPDSELRDPRAGHVDDRPRDAQPGLSVRLLPRVRPSRSRWRWATPIP